MKDRRGKATQIGRREFDRRVIETVDAILGAWIAFSEPEAIFLKLLDYLMIGLGRPAVLRVRLTGIQTKDGGSKTTSAQYEVPNFQTSQHNDGSTWSRPVDFCGIAEFEICLRTIPETSASGGPVVTQAIIKLQPSPSDEPFSQTEDSQTTDITLLDRFFQEVDRFLESAVADYMLGSREALTGEPRPNRDLQLPRVLTLLRFLGADSPLHCLLTPHQAEYFSKQSGLPPYPDGKRTVEACLTQPGWDIEDVFERGVSAWIRWPWQQDGRQQPHPLNLACANLFDAIGGDLYEDGNRHSMAPQIFAIPVHVGGKPWVTLLFAFLDDEVDTARLIYRLYRDQAPILLQRIRSLARDEYLRLVSEFAYDHFRNNGIDGPVSNFTDLSIQVAKLHPLFPFQRWIISVAPENMAPRISDDGTAAASSQVAVSLHPEDRLKVQERIQYQHLTASEVLETILSARRQATEEINAEREKSTQVSLIQAGSWAHDVKNWAGPIISYLRRGIDREEEDWEDCLRRAQIGTHILAKSAQARSDIHRFQSKPGEPQPAASFAQLPNAAARAVVLGVLNLLLYYRSDIELAKSPGIRDTIIWTPKVTLDETIGSLSDILGIAKFDRQDALLEIIGRDEVIWPLALLREPIQNIRIDNAVPEIPPDKQRRIDLAYDIKDAPHGLTLSVSQIQWEAAMWEGTPRGIVEANALYGPEGGNIGLIAAKNPVPTQILSSGDRRTAGFKIQYDLSVDFYLEPSENG